MLYLKKGAPREADRSFLNGTLAEASVGGPASLRRWRIETG
jgi:hypothetical protein